MRKEKIILSMIIVLAVLLRFVNLNQSLWLDEAAQAIESSRPFWQQTDIVADFHPPLFHFILHFWMKLSTAEAWLRLPSVLFSIGSIILVYLLGKKFVSGKAGFLAAFFLAISPYYLWYSQETRPYMLFSFLSLLAVFFLTEKRWIGFSISLALTLYSLYFAPFFVLGLFVYIWMFERQQMKKFLIATGISIALFLPWLPTFTRQLSIGTGGAFSGWTNVVSVNPVKAIPLTFAKFILGRGSIENKLVYISLITPVFLLFLTASRIIADKKEGRVLLMLFFVPFLTAVVVALFIPVLAPQRLIFILPIFCLILATGTLMFKKTLKILAFFVILITSVIGIFDYYSNPYTQREKWKEAVQFTQKNDIHDIVLFVFPEPFAPFLWYGKNNVEAMGIAPKFNLRDQDLVKLEETVAKKQKIYLFQYLTGLTDPESKTQAFLVSHGFQETIVKDFPGVGFVYVYIRK